VVKKLNLYHNSYNIDPPPFELPLQLARKKFRTLGYAAFEDELLNQYQIQRIQSAHNSFEPKLPAPCRDADVDVMGMACGKEFGLVRASNGRVYYYGKSAALGLKCVGRTPTLKLTELVISKAANIVHVAVGHDGIHALLVNDDGTVFFAGTARRGEDGDSSKNRRQPKAVKPKKMTKIDGHVVGLCRSPGTLHSPRRHRQDAQGHRRHADDAAPALRPDCPAAGGPGHVAAHGGQCRPE